MPSKRIRSYDPLTSGSGGGAVTLDVPTARWSEDVSAGDAPVIGSALTEDASVDDALALMLAKMNEDTSVDDAWSQFILSAYNEDASVNDLALMRLLNVDVARTGTPDSDLMFDAWTDQTSTGTNHGNATLQCRGVTTVSPTNDEQRAYLAIDLTGLAGCAVGDYLPGPASFTLDIQAANSNILTATTLTCECRSVSTKPFTESTVTWASPPTLGTSLGTTTVSVAAGGGFAAYTLRFTFAQISTLPGNWMLLIFTGPSAATAALRDTFTIKSRDDATAGNRPKFSIVFQRGT
jgi:hypothetical protein